MGQDPILSKVNRHLVTYPVNSAAKIYIKYLKDQRIGLHLAQIWWFSWKTMAKFTEAWSSSPYCKLQWGVTVVTAVDILSPPSQGTIHCLLSCQNHFLKWKNHFSGHYLQNGDAIVPQLQNAAILLEAVPGDPLRAAALCPLHVTCGVRLFVGGNRYCFNIMLLFIPYICPILMNYFFIHKVLFWVYRMIVFHHSLLWF